MLRRITEHLRENCLGWIISVMIVGITVLHMSTRSDALGVHELLGRLYYLPVILSAFQFGLRGGLLASGVCSLAYAPHLLLYLGNPGIQVINQLMEILLFVAVGTTTGVLSEADKRQKSELRQQLQKLRQMEEEVRIAERLGAVGQLAAGVAHEIRNPLGIIRAAAQLAKAESIENDEIKESIEIILKEVDRANLVVTRLLDFARPQGPQFSLVSITRVVQEAIQLTAHYAARHGVRICSNMPDSCLEITADRELIKQAVINLILNAVQASSAGGMVWIRVAEKNGACDAGGAGAVIEISDNGTGIPEEHLHRVFDPFFSTREKGTGLGLAIVHRIVRDHGGQIKLRSEQGKGTTVTIMLPVRKGGR